MTAVIFTGIDALRMIVETETDANSPDNETTYAAIRKAIECLFLLFAATGDDGTATSNPPDDTTGVLTDSAGGYDVDEYNGCTLLMTSGTARGNFYTIDDTTATTLICTGDNLYSAGVRSGDYYVVLYDIKVNTDGHDHDDVNAKLVTGVADDAITQSKLFVESGSVSTASTANMTLPGGVYGFYPQVKSSGSAIQFQIGGSITSTSYATTIYIALSAGTGYAQQSYVSTV